MPWNVDYLIVGAGFAGSVLAERLSTQKGRTCLVVERRNHIGGNAYDATDRAGILLHTYGPHYFRTNSDRVKDYLSQFTEWHPVEYKILSQTDGRFWQFPINLNTFEQLLGRPSTSEEMEKTLAEWRVPIANPRNSEEVIISQVGVKLYEMFFKNYTRKQWKRDPKDLDASVCGRIRNASGRWKPVAGCSLAAPDPARARADSSKNDDCSGSSMAWVTSDSPPLTPNAQGRMRIPTSSTETGLGRNYTSSAGVGGGIKAKRLLSPIPAPRPRAHSNP